MEKQYLLNIMSVFLYSCSIIWSANRSSSRQRYIVICGLSSSSIHSSTLRVSFKRHDFRNKNLL